MVSSHARFNEGFLNISNCDVHTCMCNPTIITETYYVKYGDLLYSLSGPMCPCSGSGQLEIFWTYSESGNNHGGYIDLQWLRENTYSMAKFLGKGKPKKQTIAVSIDAFPCYVGR